MHYTSEGKGRSDDRSRSQSQSALSLPESAAALGAVVTDRFGSYVQRWSQVGLVHVLTSGRWRPGARLATRTIAFAATVTLAIALAVAIVTSTHISFRRAVLVAIGAAIATSIASAIITRFRQDQRPSHAEEQAAILRIQATISSLLDRYGIEQPEINPPVKLVDTHGDPSSTDLTRRVAEAETRSSDFFLSQIADRPRLTVILGESGAGKTSLLLRLTYRMLRDRPEGNRSFIPLFFKCRDWSDDYATFHKWITATAFRSYNIPIHVTDYWIRSGRLFVALDGLNELPPNCYQGFSDAINSWSQAAEGTRLAISSTMQPSMAELVRSLGVDQLCVIQPLPPSDIQRVLRRTLSRLSFQEDVPATRVTDIAKAMDTWMQGLISRNQHLRGPALVGLLAEAIGESEQLPDEAESDVGGKDPAFVAFLVANSFFSRGDFAAARDAYSTITRLSHSRWHVPAYTLLATCLYLIGDIDNASETMIEAVALRLQESIRATPGAIEPLSETEIRCLAAVPLNLSFDIAQISSAASLPLSLSRQALQTLRERGLVETVPATDDRARFRRSVDSAAASW